MEQHEYLFDIKLFASLRVKAESVVEARKLLASVLDCAEVNCGEWPDGSPIVGEASLDDDDPDLIEIDGEAV